ncbi:MAG: hypothetical protein RIS68_100 [Bacteroidota bacterium]
MINFEKKSFSLKGRYMKREQFLRKTCPAFMLTILASSEFLTACKGSAEGEISPAGSTSQPVTTQEEKDYLARKKAIGTKGYLQENSVVYVDLANATYAALLTAGNFVNDQMNGVLLLRKDETNLLALDNCCPHLGSRNQWSYAANKFTCANHGNSYGIGTGQIANCNSNSAFGNLKAYKTSLYKDLLTITFV